MTCLDDDGSLDPFCEQLLVYDGQLAATAGMGAPPTVDLSPECHRELGPALECLRLLKALRVERAGGDFTTKLQGEETQIDAALLPGAIRFPAAFGRFELRRELGRGGFGVVFLAWDPSLKREVALKLPRPDCLMTPPLKRRFLQEGHAAAGLEHPNIVAVYEAGEIGGVCYIVSAYCPGPTLADWLKLQTAPIPPKTAAQFIAALADGIDHAHRRGILHRDLKPSNVLLAPGPHAGGNGHEAECSTQDSASGELESTIAEQGSDSQRTIQRPKRASDQFLTTDYTLRPTVDSLAPQAPRITDFGLAKLADGSGDQTRSGVMLGTPQYMSPEQVEGKIAVMGPPTDVYALGVILYEMLTGRRPFAATSEMQTLQMISAMEPERPRRLRPQVPRDLETICLRCLEKAPRQRFASAADLAADLRRYLNGEPTLSRPPGPVERMLKWARRRPAAAALVGVCILAALSLIAAGVWHVTQLEAKNVALQAAVKEADTQRESARLSAYGAHIRLASELLHNGQGGSMADALNRLRPGPDEQDLREFSWSYLWRLARNEQALRGHFHDVLAVAFSPDGLILASGSYDQTVKLWDTATGRMRLTLRGLAKCAATVVFSPNGRLVAAGDFDTWHKGPMAICVWEAATGEIVARLDDAAGLCGPIAFLLDGQTIAIPCRPQQEDRSGVVLLWNPITGQKRHIGESTGLAMAVTISPDGKLLAVAQGPEAYQLQLQLLDIETGYSKLQFSGPTQKIQALVFAPDGKTLVSSSRSDTLRFWDLASGRERANFGHEDELAWSASLTGDGQMLATLARSKPGEKNFVVKLRDPATGKVRAEYSPAGFAVFGLAAAPDGEMMALGCLDRNVRLWRPARAPAYLPAPGHLWQTWGVAFAPDGQTLATVGGDAIVRLSNTATGKARNLLVGHTSTVSCVTFHPMDHIFASGGYDKTVKLWDSAAGKLLTTLTGHTHPIRSVAFAPDGQILASGSRDKTIKLWHPASGKLLATLEGHTSDVRGLAFSADGKWLVSGGDDRRIFLWDVATQAKVFDIEEPAPVLCVAFAPDSKSFAAAGRDGTIKFWDLATRENRYVLGEHSAPVNSIAITPDGNTLASGSEDKSVRLWHIPTGQELICFKNQPHQVNSVAFSKDGKTLATGYEDGSVRLWPTETRATSPLP